MIRATGPISSVKAPGGGRIGMIACPGVHGLLNEDVAGLKRWGACGLVSLVESHELIEPLEILDLETAVVRQGLWWRHLPIRDGDIPDENFEKHWLLEGPRARQLLAQGESFVFHCWAGLGRSGLMTARVLIEMGCASHKAIRAVRNARPGAIETKEQSVFLNRLVSERSFHG